MDHYLVVDVHTDINTDQALEEGIGHLDIILAAYKVPDGRIIIGAGPVFSYYEFKQPVSDRLTDETWCQLVHSSNCPERPPWISSFCLDKDNKDQRATLPYSLSLKGDEPSDSQCPIYTLNGLKINF